MDPAWTARTESAPLPREQLLLPSTSKMHIGSKQSSLLSSSQRAPASRAGSTLSSHTEGSRLAASHADILSQSLPQEQTGQFLSPHFSFGIFWWFPLSYKAQGALPYQFLTGGCLLNNMLWSCQKKNGAMWSGPGSNSSVTVLLHLTTTNKSASSLGLPVRIRQQKANILSSLLYLSSAYYSESLDLQLRFGSILSSLKISVSFLARNHETFGSGKDFSLASISDWILTYLIQIVHLDFLQVLVDSPNGN